MADARLRKTFQYPDSDDEEPEGIDEEEQEKVIAALHAEDASKSALYNVAFTIITLLPIIIILPSLFRPSTSLPAFLSVTSLLSNAYILHFLPFASQTTKRKPSFATPLSGTSNLHDRLTIDPGSPLGKYLLPLNGGLAGILTLWALSVKSRRDDWTVLLLPGIMFVLIVFVRQSLRPIDVDSLEKLRYGYKGA